MAGLVFDDVDDVDPAMPLVEPFREWVALLASRKSVATVRGYVSDVAVFAEALLTDLGRPPGPIAEVAPDDLPLHLARGGMHVLPASTYRRAESLTGQLTLSDLHPRNCARTLDGLGSTRGPSSQRRLASAWSSLCRLLVRRGLLAANPMEHDAVERPRKPGPAPAPLDYSDAERLLQTILEPDSGSRWPWPARDFALAAVLLASGLRVGEACSVRYGDMRAVDVSPRLRVLGKGRKERILPLHAAAVEALHAYLSERVRKLGAVAANDPLFVRANGSPFTERSMRRLVDRWYARAGVRRVPGACVHALRHTFATTALDSGASVVEVQTLLGHASLDTTRNYLAVVGNGMERTIAAHPLGQMVTNARLAGASGG